MPDEHESSISMWLDDPTIQREVEVIRGRFPEATEFHAFLFSMIAELLSHLYGDRDGPDITIEINKPAEDEIDEADRWKYIDPDQLGSP
jgi:hypothetical protein